MTTGNNQQSQHNQHTVHLSLYDNCQQPTVTAQSTHSSPWPDNWQHSEVITQSTHISSLSIWLDNWQHPTVTTRSTRTSYLCVRPNNWQQPTVTARSTHRSPLFSWPSTPYNHSTILHPPLDHATPNNYNRLTIHLATPNRHITVNKNLITLLLI